MTYETNMEATKKQIDDNFLAFFSARCIAHREPNYQGRI